MRAILTAFCLLLLIAGCLVSTHSYAREKLTTRSVTVMTCLKADRTCTNDSECCSDVCFKKPSKGTAKCWPKVVLW
jgi:hypothetical protein